MIDLSIRENKENPVIAKVRGKAVKISTGVLAGYLIAVSVFAGWWLFFRQKEQTVSEELKTLTSEVTAKSEQEVLVRKLANRADGVSAFIKTRGDYLGAAKKLVKEEASVSGWLYIPDVNQKVTVSASEAASLEDYSGKLTKDYPVVYFESINWSDKNGWTADVVVGGRE